MKYKYHCNECGNDETLDTLNENWLCICKQKPVGLSYLHVCSECNNHRWGFKNSVECEVCFAKRLSNVTKIEVIPFGDAVNIPKRDRKLESELFEKNWQRWEDAKQKSLQNKIDEQQAILSLPKLLGEISTKLDQVFDTKVEYDDNGYVKFACMEKDDFV